MKSLRVQIKERQTQINRLQKELDVLMAARAISTGKKQGKPKAKAKGKPRGRGRPGVNGGLTMREALATSFEVGHPFTLKEAEEALLKVENYYTTAENLRGCVATWVRSKPEEYERVERATYTRK